MQLILEIRILYNGTRIERILQDFHREKNEISLNVSEHQSPSCFASVLQNVRITKRGHVTNHVLSYPLYSP